MDKNDLFKKFVLEAGKGEYTPLSDYINSQTHILMRHNTCGNEYKVTPNVFKNGKRCPYCAGNRKLTHESFSSKVKKKYGDDVEILGRYDGNHKKILFRHKKCGKIFSKDPYRLLNDKSPCPFCCKNRKHDQKWFEQKVFELTKGEYKVIGNYKNNKTKIELKHEKCGSSYFVTPRDFIKKYGNRCPRCTRETRPEKVVREWLEKEEIEFQSQFKIKGLKGISKKQSLSFDFKVSCTDGSFILIEVDGYYHFNSPSGKEKLLKQKRNDAIKDEYCKKHGIQLMRIIDTFPNKKWKSNIIKNLKTLL